jgi:hypothetical protein
LDLEKIIEIAAKCSVELEYIITGRRVCFGKKPLKLKESII